MLQRDSGSRRPDRRQSHPHRFYAVSMRIDCHWSVVCQPPILQPTPRARPKKDATARQSAGPGRGARCEGCRNDAEAATTRGHPLDCAGDGEGHRPRRLDGAGDLEIAWSGAAPLAQLQAVQRSRLSPGSFTPLLGSTSHRSPTPSSSASTRSPRSRRLTAHSRACRSKKGRGATMTHDYKRHGTTTLFRRAERPDRRGVRPKHATPPASGVHPLPERVIFFFFLSATSRSGRSST